jgi:5-oxoprolinase (ATP-hydrolysing) subunit B
MILRRYGDRAWLVETEDPLGLRDAALALRGVDEVVPAARTLLVQVDPSSFDVESLRGLHPAAAPEAAQGPPLPLPVRYDGPDLSLVASTAGCSVEDVVERHSAGVYTVAFCGFAPGFAYLRGLDESLQQPRLDSPRTSVAAGSVGVAGEFTGVYPRASPGGWRLLGRTAAPLWQLDRDPPALLAPGTRVRFVPQ